MAPQTAFEVSDTVHQRIRRVREAKERHRHKKQQQAAEIMTNTNTTTQKDREDTTSNAVVQSFLLNPQTRAYLARRHVYHVGSHADPRSDGIHTTSLTSCSFSANVWTMKDFEILEHIMLGKFGTIVLAHDNCENRLVVLKMLAKDNGRLNIQREIETHACLSHDNIIQLFGYCNTIDQVIMVMEYIPGDLSDFVFGEGGHLPKDDTALIIRQVVQALVHCQEHHIAHRDIKPENVLYYEPESLAKVCDFGMSCQAPPPTYYHTTLVGTAEFLPPEIIRTYRWEQTCYDVRFVDVWSVGVMTFDLAHGSTPFHVSRADIFGYDDDDDSTSTCNWSSQSDVIRRNEVVFDLICEFQGHGWGPVKKKEDDKVMTRNFRSFCDVMMNPEAEERPSAREALEHPFLQPPPPPLPPRRKPTVINKRSRTVTPCEQDDKVVVEEHHRASKKRLQQEVVQQQAV